MNAPRNKTAILFVANDLLTADTLGYFPGRDHTIIIASGHKEKPTYIEAARLLRINRMTRYNRIDTPPTP